MSEAYPLPSHAASFWISGDDLMVAFPGTRDARGHTIRLPASAGGLAHAIAILKERAHASNLQIGNPGSPTQYQIDHDRALGAMLQSMRRDRDAERAAKRAEAEDADALLKELGL